MNWSGVAAMALLGFRIHHWARYAFPATPSWVADALASAVITAAPIASQSATLQNDVWLAAFTVDALWRLMEIKADGATSSLATLSLIKPYGFVISLIVAVSTRAKSSAWLAAIAPFTFWVIHDVLLWKHATGATSIVSIADQWGTTIASHGFGAFLLFAQVMVAATPFGFLAFCAALFGPAISRGRPALGFAACLTAMLFFVMPLAYADWHPQLASGGSLRFVATSVALGALLLYQLLTLAPVASGVVLLISTAYGTAQTLLIYSSDNVSWSSIPVALLAAYIVGRSPKKALTIPAGVATAVMVAYLLASKSPAAYFSGSWLVHGQRTRIYEWIAEMKPKAVGGIGLRLGAVNQLSPTTRTVDLQDVAGCETAIRLGVLMIALSEDDRSESFNRGRLNSVRNCGKTVYDDGVGVVVRPRP